MLPFQIYGGAFRKKGGCRKQLAEERPPRTKSQSSRRAQAASFPYSYLLTSPAHIEEFEFVGEETN